MKELSLHILDIAQNSVRAESNNIKIIVIEDIKNNIFSFSIDDDGKGIDDKILETIRNPFTTTRKTRNVGLGIPLLDSTCKSCNGMLVIKKKKRGTYIKAEMEMNHIDRPPLGDIVSTISGLMISNEKINIIYEHFFNNDSFEISTNEIKSVLDTVPINDLSVVKWLKSFLKENLENLRKY